ncbi:uncharacterized protein B0T15DRAFT_520400 [Chaetomium strumarium]|uniref:Clr5 domain-containing protein n=1 Tax=Chaetomium strumarium TaxID=1170767 RepID=A0AAJ0H3Y3_9PEZI|nr:hypothetical protein B0T15DRAFT_520400 [Chaetomium strumarium]
MVSSLIRQQFVWKTTPVAPRAQPVSPEHWEGHRKIICEMYKSATLEEVMRYMEANHGFAPSRKQYILQLGKWGLRKYGKEPVRVALEDVSMPGKASGISDGPPDYPLPEPPPAKRRKLGDTVPRETRGTNRNTSHGVSTSQSEGPCCNSNKRIFPASLLGSTLADGLSHTEIEVEIEQVELAAEFFLHSRCYEDSYRLYTLLLNWTKSHGAPLCPFAFELLKRVVIGRARSGEYDPENPTAGRLSGWDDVAEEDASVLFYRRVRLWESQRASGVLRAYEAAIRDTQADYFRQAFLKPKTAIRDVDGPLGCSRLGMVDCFANSSSVDVLIVCLRWLLRRATRPSLASRMHAEAVPAGSDDHWRRVLFTSMFTSFWGEFRDEVKLSDTPSWAEMMNLTTGISATELLAVVTNLVLQHAPAPSSTSGVLNIILYCEESIDLVIEGMLGMRNEQLAERFFRAFVDPARLRPGTLRCTYNNIWDDVAMRLSRATVLKHLNLEPVSFLDLISQGAPAHQDSEAQPPDPLDWTLPVTRDTSPAPESASSNPADLEAETGDNTMLTASPIAVPIGVPGRTTGPQLPPLTDQLHSPDYKSMAALRDHITATVDLQSAMSKLSIDLPSAVLGPASWKSIKSSPSQGLRRTLGYGVFSGVNSPAFRFSGSAAASLGSVLSGASR